MASATRDDQGMVLEVPGVSKYFGGLQVLQDVSLEILFFAGRFVRSIWPGHEHPINLTGR